MTQIKKTYYKDRPCIQIISKNMSAKFLHEDGGKLASLKFDETEYLAQREGDTYHRLFEKDSYVASECSGFDDMFPTIDSCAVGDFCYPDHGEVSRRPFHLDIGDTCFTLSCRVDSVNAVFSKTISIEDGALIIKYQIENKNNFPLPYIWAGHIMLMGEKGAYITSPFSESTSYTTCFGVLYKDKCVLQGYGENKEYKFYYDEPYSPLFCSVVYPSGKQKINFTFDGTVKYLGFWFNPGDLNGMYNLAVEPCTAPYDTPIKADLAKKGSFIEQQASIGFVLKITFGEV